MFFLSMFVCFVFFFRFSSGYLLGFWYFLKVFNIICSSLSRVFEGFPQGF